MLDQELLENFQEETRDLLGELSQIVEQLGHEHREFPVALFEEFAQKTDRIMGAAKTFEIIENGHPGLLSIGNLTELCKRIGYQASKKREAQLIPLCVAFWSDTIENIHSLLDHIDDAERCKQLSKTFTGVLEGRLQWLAEHLK